MSALATPAAHAADIDTDFEPFAIVTQGADRYELMPLTCARNAELQMKGATTKHARAYGRWLEKVAAAHPSASTFSLSTGGAFNGGGCYERIPGGIRVYRTDASRSVDVLAPLVPTDSTGEPLARADAQQARTTQPERPIQVSALDLYTAYNANEVAADDKFKGRLLAVTGPVGRVGKDLRANPYVTLQAGDDPFQVVTAYFGKDKDADLSKLQKGETVRITCRGGGVLLMAPVLKCAGRP